MSKERKPEIQIVLNSIRKRPQYTFETYREFCERLKKGKVLVFDFNNDLND